MIINAFSSHFDRLDRVGDAKFEKVDPVPYINVDMMRLFDRAHGLANKLVSRPLSDYILITGQLR